VGRVIGNTVNCSREGGVVGAVVVVVVFCVDFLAVAGAANAVSDLCWSPCASHGECNVLPDEEVYWEWDDLLPW